MPYRFCLVIAALVLGFASPVELSGAGLTPESRMTIVRGLTAEYATLKVFLPRGEEGLTVDTQGEVDKEALLREMTQNGTAISPNVLVQITAIEFKGKEIVFEINGGGKKKTKWYEHIEVGMGSGTYPIAQGSGKTPTGSYVVLKFSQSLPDLTVEELKSYLGPALDFNPVSPIQTLTRPIPPEFREAIEAKQATIGMDRQMVQMAMGHPQHKVRETKDGVEQEDWIYGTPPQKVIFVTFEGDEVVDIKEYRGGVAGQTQPHLEDPIR